MKRRQLHGGLCAAALLLTGCAGAQVPAAAGPVAASSTACGGTAFAKEALERINRWRASARSCGTAGRFAAAPPLAWNDVLARAALGHSKDMAQQRYFAHMRPGGRTLQQRIDDAAYPWRAIGENIAAGPDTVAAAVEGWQRSDPHCANLMSPDFTEVGLACVPASAGDRYDRYWTLDFGKPR